MAAADGTAGKDSTPSWYNQPIDVSAYNLDSEELAFFKAATGIEDEAELKAHICSVQSDAFSVYPYPCIRNFHFTKLKISRLPAYPEVLQLARERPDPLLLDIGCCFGNDARKVIADGWPAANIICSDLRPEFWDLGHKLFRDKQSFGVPFVAGDVFNPNFLSPRPGTASETLPSLNSVTSLTQLKTSISVIHASAFFHLFDKDRQTQLASLLSTLLSPLPGSIILGSHGGSDTPHVRDDRGVWADNPQSWQKLWEAVLGEGKCRVTACLRERKRKEGSGSSSIVDGRVRQILEWSVVRM